MYATGGALLRTTERKGTIGIKSLRPPAVISLENLERALHRLKC